MGTTTSTTTNVHVAALAAYMGNPANAKAIEALDAAYANGTTASRTAQYAANGALAARKAKGYGRNGLAVTLAVPEKTVWHMEYYLPKGHKAVAAWVAAIAKLAPASKGTAATPPKAKASTPPKAKPAPKGTAKPEDVL